MREFSSEVLLRNFLRLSLLLTFLLHRALAQDAAAADRPLRPGLTWQHNGQVFSILSRGAQYRPSTRRHSGSQPRGNPVVVVTSGNNDTASAATQHRGPPRVPAASGTAQLRAVTRGRQQQQQQQRREPPTDGGDEPESAPVGREDMMVGDDPYNPYKSSNYYPYYNYYNSYYRPRPRAHYRPGYGTGYHQNGGSAEPEPEPLH